MSDIPNEDIEIIKPLAERVAEISALPEQAEKIRLWKAHNACRSERPMILAFPEGGWDELLPEDPIRCTHSRARRWERDLRMRIFRHEQIRDDWPETPVLRVWPAFTDSGIGAAAEKYRTETKGAANWEPPIKSPEDISKLHLPEVQFETDATEAKLAEAREIFDGRLEVRQLGVTRWSLGLTQDLIYLRGLMQVMMDLYDDPALLHDLMAFLRDAAALRLDALERQGGLVLNNAPDSYAGSGGNGCTDELPADDFDGHVRCTDLWVLGESQEFSEVGPDHFHEFVLSYQKPLLERFGLVCYGCCEPLDSRFDMLIDELPRLRRLSISPWCDRTLAAEKLGDRYIYSWKPNPSRICSPRADWDAAQQDIRQTLDIARGCNVEMVMKDTHTFHHDPTRPGRWCDLARRIAEEMA